MTLAFDYAIFIVLVLFTAIFIGLYFYFNRNFNFWHKLGVPYVKPTPFVGSLKECVLRRTTIGQHFRKIYDECSVTSYVGIFSFDQPSLLIRDLELVKNILVKDSQSCTDRVVMFNEEVDPLLSRIVCVMVNDGAKFDHV